MEKDTTIQNVYYHFSLVLGRVPLIKNRMTFRAIRKRTSQDLHRKSFISSGMRVRLKKFNAPLEIRNSDFVRIRE